MTQVFVVIGETGEYSDHDDWAVMAYLVEAEAQAHVLRLDGWLREHKMHMDDSQHVIFLARTDAVNPHDPDFRASYTGTRYYVLPVPLAESAEPQNP